MLHSAQEQISRHTKLASKLTPWHLRFVIISLGVLFVLLGLGSFRQRAGALKHSRALANFGIDREVILVNSEGVEVHILTVGAVVQKLLVPDRKGALADVVLGFDDLKPYKDGTSPYFGAVVGRVANRIADAKFVLDGRQYNLSANDPPNSLHGGARGWSRRDWKIVKREAFDDGGSSVRLSYVSANMEEGYPGKATASVTYSLLAPSTLRLDIEVEAGAPTPVNVAQHTYFNLEGVDRAHTVLDHTLWINSTHVTPVDATRIPTGEVKPVAGTPFDFGQPHSIGDRISEVPGPAPGGYDINYVLWGRDGAAALRDTSRCAALPQPALAAKVHAPESGRTLEVLTTAPGLQFYSGNFLDGSLTGKGGVKYVQHGGFAVETQMFPNFVNEPKFPQCILRPGETYKATVVWRFSAK